MINVNYGYLMESYFLESSKKFDKPSDRDKDWLELNRNGNNGKLTFYSMPLEPFEPALLKILIYILSFGIKFYLDMKLQQFK